MSTEYYDLLGVSKGASDAELKAAYRKKVKQYHPDINKEPDAEETFKKISNAYDVLKDPQKRSMYDQYGEEGVNGSAGAGGGHGGGFGGFGDFSDIFSDFFGNGSGGGSNDLSGSDLRYNLEITLEEAYNGAKKEFSFKGLGDCEKCNSTGSSNKSKPKVCKTCNGTGAITTQQGFFAVQRTCGTCRGVGQIISDPCYLCNGEGRVVKNQKISVNIPAGINEGNRLRVANKGEAGIRGARSGDLYVFISIAHHKFFERDGSDLHCRFPILVTELILGSVIEVPTLDNNSLAKITIPSGTQHGQKFRLRGKGMPMLDRRNMKGDLYVHIECEVPINLNNEQQDLVKQLNETLSKKSTSPKVSGFMNKIKSFLSGN